MKMTRQVADFDRLRARLGKNGFDGERWCITTGTIIQIGKKVEGSDERLGLILLDGKKKQIVGFRPSHQFTFTHAFRRPQVGDKVFVVPFSPPDKTKRPYALKWGLLADLGNPENGFTKTENFFGYMLGKIRQAFQEWSRSEP